MEFFDFLRAPDINQGVEEQRNTKDSVLIDVREKSEYQSGHIPGSKNVPLSTLEKSVNVAPSSETPLFVYCLSGARSRPATGMLKSMGYTDVKNIGGISAWHGEVER